MPETKSTRNVAISNPEGLHARAATLIAELVRGFQCQVHLVKNAERVEGTDVLQMLSLGAGQGEELLLEATGLDAEQVLNALEKLFSDNFSEN